MTTNPAKVRKIADRGELYDVEWHKVVQSLILIASTQDAAIAEFTWYVEPIDNDQMFGASIAIPHALDEGDEVNVVEVPIIMSLIGIDANFGWRAGWDLTNRVVGIRYRRRGT